ncbi:YraN family protein [Rhodoblastus sp.]|jgi:putative endonuclease|uniref:YraN family protein n=1 Tax=Rhodoblastus sp. TaxID=1962975 RepID=UPI002614CD45|nr:YraN family protein [Rhodoblastus sp.]
MTSRAAARVFGLRAEALAAFWLRLKFFRILARNYSASGGEIDIVARRGQLVAFVEVKARPTYEAAQIAIDARKVARLSRAVRVWLAAHPWASDCALRGDAVLIAPRRPPRHVAGAFELDLFA